MSKAASGPMKTTIAQPGLTLAACWLIVRRDGVLKAYTEFDQDLLVNLGDGNGLVTYIAAAGFDRTAIKSTNTMAVANLNVIGLFDPDEITRNDVIAGKYDMAEVKIFMVNWTNLSQGIIRFHRGHLGQIAMKETSFEAELRGLLQRYSDELLPVYTSGCRADLGDQIGFSPSIHGCKVRVNPPVWLATTAYTVKPVRDGGLGSVVKPTVYNDRQFNCTTAGTSGATEPSWNLTIGGTTSDGSVVWTTDQAKTIETTVDVVTDNGNFTVAYAGDAPDDFLLEGLAQFQNGNNSGLNMEIKSWGLTGKAIKLFLPMPLDIVGASESNLLLEDDSGDGLLLEDGSGILLLEAGDIVHLRAGCIKTVPACQAHDNIFNYKGEPYIPGAKVIFRTPKASG